MAKTVTNLCMIFREDKILLGLKKRKFGAGLWNGYGGKVILPESIEEALLREVKEEAEIEVKDLEKIGYLEFYFKTGEALDCHIYKTDKFTGEPTETEEMVPRWYSIGEIPFDKMWPEDKFWFPYMFAGKKFTGKFIFDHPYTAESPTKILEKELKEVENL